MIWKLPFMKHHVILLFTRLSDRRVLLHIVGLCFAFACQQKTKRNTSVSTESNPLIIEHAFIKPTDTTDTERYLLSKHLVNIKTLDSSIRVSLLYSTTHNFLNKEIYNGLSECYLPCDVAIKLCNAQYLLKLNFPEYNIIVFDAVRPLSAQKQMWEELKLPYAQKINYLAHPDDISLHNYGAAVDIGIISNQHTLLDMGTPYDTFNELSEPKNEWVLYRKGKLSKQALANRLLLRSIMKQAGFTPIATEWWHFNATSKAYAASRYELIQ